jgi:hypothetical protein
MEEMFSVQSMPGLYNEDQFGNPEEGARLPLEAITKQQLVKTGKTLCVL